MSTTPDLHLAFDVGHSSIGWAVLQAKPSLELLGCGAVIFQADDCLASQRRQFRRQRRHIRSTRLRIARMKALLAHLAVLTKTQLDQVSSSSPWFLAARVLRGGNLLTWPQLWDVLRWYAHNRGYDGNKAWSRQDDEAVADKEDAEKVKNAFALYEKHQTATMSETWCAVCGIDPLGGKTSCALPGKDRPKGLNAAFPREDVETEVARVVRAHFGKLPGADEKFLTALMTDWRAISCPGIKLPGRFRGGLLFGQLVPRFENRIIARCPMTYERVYERILDESGDAERAKHEAEKQAKVPSADCPEFLRYRWLMQVANVLVHTGEKKEPQRLSAEQRQALDARMAERGALTRGELTKAVEELTGGAPSNVKLMLLHPDAEKALVVDPALRELTRKDIALYYAALPERLQKRVRGQLRRGAHLSLGKIREQLEMLGDTAAFDGVLAREIEAAETKRGKKTKPVTREDILSRCVEIPAISGRAPHSREIMREVAVFVLSTNRHPAEEGGPLYRSESIRSAQLQRAIDEQTNNHLVRHRLRLLERLHADLLAKYLTQPNGRVGKITIEVNRDLKELSGKTAKQIAEDLGLRLSNFNKVAEKLAEQLAGKGIAITPGLIRKARVAEDLGWACPYTGKPYDVFDLVHRRVDKDHIVPRSERASDSLDSLVITFAEVNRMKGKRTAARFVEDCQSQTVEGAPNLTIKPLTTFLAYVEKLETSKGHDDDKKRKRNRKRLLLLRDYVEKEFVPRDLTQTSQLVRLGAQSLERHYAGREDKPVITSLPGSVTGAVRKSWHLLPLLKSANPLVMDPATGEVRTKTEIRDITHLHHALDACTLVFASLFLPRDGGAWELLVKRKLNTDEQKRARELFKTYVEFEKDGTMRLIELPEALKAQICRRLGERRVVQHVAKEIRGLPTELNAWRVVEIENGIVSLHQRTRQLDGSRPLKKAREKSTRLIGLAPGKLSTLKAALVVKDNYGMALEPTPTIIPFHKVWNRLRELRKENLGKPIRVLRAGMLVRLKNTRPSGCRDGVWRIYTVQATLKIDLVKPDILGRPKKGADVWREVSIRSLGVENIEIVPPSLCGAAI